MKSLRVTKQGKVNGNTLNAIKRNLEPYLNCLTDEERDRAANWYHEAYELALGIWKRVDAYSMNQVITVIAVLSPGCRWETNLKDAENLLVGHREGCPEDIKVSTYGANKRKAIAILNGEARLEPKSQKTFAFAHNIAEPDHADHTTVDRHAYKALIGDNNGGSVPIAVTQYRIASMYYEHLAAEWGYTPCALQAVIWEGYKKFNNR